MYRVGCSSHSHHVPTQNIPSPASPCSLNLAQTERDEGTDREREREREQKLFGSPAGIRRLTPLHPNQQQLKAWIFLAWNQIWSPTPEPGRLWKKKQPPHHHQTASSWKEEETQLQKCVVEKKQKSIAGAMEIAKEQIFFFCSWKWTHFSRHREKTFQQDCGTQVWHPPPSGLWRASACYFTNTSSLFSAIQIHILHLQSCGHFGSMKATCTQTNNRGLRCVWVYESTSSRCRWGLLYVDIRYEEL